MIARALRALALTLALAGGAAADAPDRSPRPAARPAAAALAPIVDAVRQALASIAPQAAPRPEARPKEASRPARVRRAAPAVPVSTTPGPVCGDAAIVGTMIAPIEGRLPACGIARPVRLTSVADLRLSRAATVDCPTAKALKTWVARDVKRLVARRGGGATGLRVVAHYACRGRNNQPGAKLSEHALGHAIDIAAIQLADGTELSVLEDWSDRRNGRLMKRLHRAACGPFGTVLGPNSDRFHQNHFHLDTARYRLGSYCR